MEQNEPGEQEATPTSPADTSVADVPQQPTQQEAPQEQPTDTQTQEELPEGVTSDHAKNRFQDLAERATTAEEALEDLRNRRSVFDEFMPQAPVQQAPQQNFGPPLLQQFTDTDGNVDVQSFDQAMLQYHQATQYGSQQATAQVRQMDQRLQERETYTKYPELDPTAKDHDEDFKKLVAGRMAMNWANGINEPFIEAADYIAQRYAKRQTDDAIAKQAVEQYKAAQENREQGPMEKGRSVGREEIGVDKLREISVKGSNEQREAAIIERLRRAGQ